MFAIQLTFSIIGIIGIVVFAVAFIVEIGYNNDWWEL